MEQITLTAPVTPPITSWKVRRLFFDLGVSSIYIELKGSGKEMFTHTYSGPTALTMMMQLNSANLSVKSLQRRVLEQLVADGVLPPGVVTGTPEL